MQKMYGGRPVSVVPLMAFFAFALLLLSFPVSALAAGDTEIAVPDAVKAQVAELSDEEARKLLIAELAKSTQTAGTQHSPPPIAGLALGRLLSSLSSKSDASEMGARQLIDALVRVGPDLRGAFTKLCPYNTASGAVENVLWVLFFLSAGFLCEFLFDRLFLRKLFTSISAGAVPETISGFDKLMTSIVKELPHLLGLFIFFCSSYLVFTAFIWTESPNVQLFFLALLIIITAIRTLAILSRIVLSPYAPLFRLIPLECPPARSAYRGLLITFSYILAVMMLGVVLRKLGTPDPTIKLYFLFAATLLLAGTGLVALLVRKKVADAIINAPSRYGESASWGRSQFAAIWHLLAIAYLVILWFLLFNDLIDPAQGNRGAFLLSFFIVPIWMVCDKLLQWLVTFTMATLKIHQEEYEHNANLTEEDIHARERGKTTFLKVMNFSRGALVFILLIWIASLWNIYIPIFSNLSKVLFDALIILTIAIVFWQFISSWIERKIQESLPDEPVDKEDDEWGGAANRGRSYTLLPMLRKFIGTILVTMVTMTLLSSMGVDIGPLLAGAGVVGLAVGFGAQKLVADMFSGFFYLLDDAFRVGEYIEAGGITGTVENISLRNVMLRHHRGMLQIVPHSELGAVTNYMRGGIIVKFNLDFPYDADIDQIRKVIKKVGQAMAEEEEFKDDFIRPLKSQGVREITNSVMTIRAKFTAKPGAHFLIRREAYKRITEALRAKGIHYAHRKVIVDLPQQLEGNGDQLAKAAGAAAREAIDAEEQAKGAAAGGGKTMPFDE